MPKEESSHGSTSKATSYTIEYPQQNHRPKEVLVRRSLQKRNSFSLTQTKFGDAGKLWHPLKEKVKMGKGPSLNDSKATTKMK